VFRWYRPRWGRYSQADPIWEPRSVGELSPFGYGLDSPLQNADPTGERSQVCCRTIPHLLGFRHCYISIEREGKSTTCGLLGGKFSGEEYATGRIYRDHDFNRGGDCGEWNDDCGTDNCVIKAAQSYANPSRYHYLLGANSNTFVGTIARACGLAAPKSVGTATPGWGKSPAKPKDGRVPEPVPCGLP
jgi:hypothetical protein